MQATHPKLLFTHGYFLEEDPREQEIMKPYPPLGLLYLSAWLERSGVENEVFDTTFSSREALQTALLDQKPHILALYVNLMTKRNILRLVRFVRAQESLRHCLLVAGGPDATHNVADYLAAGLDVMVIGEGEQTMLELTQAARQLPGHLDATDYAAAGALHSAFSNVPGLAYLLPDGSVHQTAPREKMRDLDGLPLPNRHKIDLNAYLQAWKNRHGYSAVSISTQRGCPYTCRWCSTAVYGQSYRRRSPSAVADEIQSLQRQYDFDLIWFVDDVFTVSHKWLHEFRDVLEERGLRIRFECITRADRLNMEVLHLLRDCGCFRVWIGAESGSQRIIDAMDRRVEVGQVQAMIQAAGALGMETGTFIMLGYPGETETDIRATLRHLQTANPDLFTITVAYPIKGTGLYEEVGASAQSTIPWDERSDRDLDFKRTYPRRYYDYAVRWMVNGVLWHKRKINGQAWHWRSWILPAKIAAARMGMLWFRLYTYK